jgi:hypothetical protein
MQFICVLFGDRDKFKAYERKMTTRDSWVLQW